MTAQDEKILVKLQEFQLLNLWLNQMVNMMRATESQLAQKPGDIQLLSSRQNLDHDIKEISKLVVKHTQEIASHFEAKYGMKIKSLKKEK